jgi:uncharacterized membrane protein
MSRSCFEMSLTPLLNAAPEIQLHAFAAMSAFALGIVQLAAPKGTLPHRTLGWIWVVLTLGWIWVVLTLGWIWVVLMLVISASSFLIHGIRMWGPWSPIHILSVFTPIMLAVALVAARRHRVRAHKITMMSVFAGALVLAGLFTLVPGRIMHTVLFGP